MSGRLVFRLTILIFVSSLIFTNIGLQTTSAVADQPEVTATDPPVETLEPGLTPENTQSATESLESPLPLVTETLEFSPSPPDTSFATTIESKSPDAVPSPRPVTDDASNEGVETSSSAFTSMSSSVAKLKGEYLPDEVITRFKKSATPEMIAACLALVNGRIASTIDELGVTKIKIEEGYVSEAVALISTCPGVRYVEPNYIAHIADTIPTDPGFGLQYGLNNIRAPQGWDLRTGSSSVTIAILDTGVQLGHPDLAGKIVGGYDFVNDDSFAQDDNGHGTHVAGIAAAMTNNSLGVAGVSWGARIMPVKVLNAAGNGTFTDVAAGLIWAADNGAQVINLSLGGTSHSEVLQAAVDYAAAKGVVLVAAAGNTGANFVLYPARYPNVIAVAATDTTNTHASFSNYGPEIDLSAPGVSIYSTALGGTYSYRNGTSMAAGYVSGLAAILRGIGGNSSPSAITLEMESTSLDLGLPGWDDFYGCGLIQMDAALIPLMPSGPAQGFGAAPPTGYFGPYFTATSMEMSLPALTPTWTEAAIPTSSAITPTGTLLTPDVWAQSGITETPETLSAATNQKKETTTFSTLPCAGSLLVLLGIWLFWMANRRRRYIHSHPRSLKLALLRR